MAMNFTDRRENIWSRDAFLTHQRTCNMYIRIDRFDFIRERVTEFILLL